MFVIAGSAYIYQINIGGMPSPTLFPTVYTFPPTSSPTGLPWLSSSFEEKLVAFDMNAYDNYGRAVSMFGNMTMVGSVAYDGDSFDIGMSRRYFDVRCDD